MQTTSIISLPNNYDINILHEGYSTNVNGGIEANCSCVLLTGKVNVIIDTMTAWDKGFILAKLKNLRVNCKDINYVISTHGHSDHCGNNNLFLQAKHIVGHCFSFKNKYFDVNFSKGEPLKLEDGLTIMPTPGHTLTDVSVFVETSDGNVVIAGDTFERFEDLSDDSIWLEAGSEDPDKQRESRKIIIAWADWIIPGHGRMFKVTQDIKRKFS